MLNRLLNLFIIEIKQGERRMPFRRKISKEPTLNRFNKVLKVMLVTVSACSSSIFAPANNYFRTSS